MSPSSDPSKPEPVWAETSTKDPLPRHVGYRDYYRGCSRASFLADGSTNQRQNRVLLFFKMKRRLAASSSAVLAGWLSAARNFSVVNSGPRSCRFPHLSGGGPYDDFTQ